MPKNEKMYCSLDIETSGFDPLTEEVLEVGFIKFKVKSEKLKIGDTGLEILEEWTRVFKPAKAVDPKILGLTGISPKELETAPNFEEFKDEIQNKIKGAVIVGHNVTFDTKFLESRGLKFSGKVIDTLDLAQWLLPTHHSYNLESLMHYFGIKHENAHRALADAKAALEVLMKFFSIYAGFPDKLKTEIQKVLKPFAFEWQEPLLTYDALRAQASPGALAKKPVKHKIAGKPLALEAPGIYNFNLGADVLGAALAALSKSRKLSLLVLPKRQEVMRLWKEYGLSAVWEPEQLFDEKKFSAFLGKKLTPEEARFALKILVWRATNWQNKALLDLNLSFFGGQFKQLVSGGSWRQEEGEKVLICDIDTFLSSQNQRAFLKRLVVFLGLAEFESAVSSNLTDRVSWGQVNYVLKSIYNPELAVGDARKKGLVEELLNASDLFFGLVSALFQSDPPVFLDIAVTEEFRATQKYEQMRAAAENFSGKLITANQTLKSELLRKSADNLTLFFSQQPNRVKWLELSRDRCAFHNAPLHIKDHALKVLSKYPRSVFVDVLAPKQAFDYFVERLGLSAWPVTNLTVLPAQADLFNRPREIVCEIGAKAPTREELLGLVAKDNLPAAVLFGLPKQLKEFYELNYQELKTYSTLLSQTGSGGTGKLFHNFSINQNGLLLITDRSVLKSLNGFSNNVRPAKLAVKTLVILRLPFDPVSHPYAQALAATYPNAFSAMALPKALYNFHQLVSFFLTPKLKQVFLFDPKLNKAYARAFYEYLDLLRQKSGPA